VLFFDRSGPTKEIWYYELHLPEGRKNYSKTKPLLFEDFADCLTWWYDRKENDQAWSIPADKIAENGYNLDLKNPNGKHDLEQLQPEELVESILAKEERITEIIDEIKWLLAEKR
jgi:type I restriction enzyme M protein